MRLLLVEDEERVARFVARGLRGASYAVDEAGDGAAALLASINVYDAVILDVMLPRERRLTVCRELRASASACPS